VNIGLTFAKIFFPQPQSLQKMKTKKKRPNATKAFATLFFLAREKITPRKKCNRKQKYFH